jgi:SecD/SecF fusion protein
LFGELIKLKSFGKVAAVFTRWSMIAAAVAAVALSCSNGDIKGGTQLLVGADLTGLKNDAERNHAMDAARSRIEKRLQKFGFRFQVEMKGTNFVVKVSTADQNKIYELCEKIGANGFFEMRVVHPESDDLTKNGKIPEGYQLAHFRVPNGDRTIDKPKLITSERIEALTSRHIKHAYPKKISKSTVVNFEFDEIGTKAFADFTSQHSNSSVAMLLDGQVLAVPTIFDRVTNGRVQLVGYFDKAEATAIANILENPIEAPLQVLEIRTFLK